MDSSTTQLLSLIVSTFGTVAVAWIGFRIKRLEHNTNSIKDALVATTAKASHAEGKLEAQHEAAAVGAIPPVITPPAG